MYKYLSKNGQLLAFGLGALLTALFLISWLGGQASLDALPDDEQYKTGIFDVGILGATAFFAIGALLAVGFGIYQTATNFKNSAKGLIGIVALIVIFVIAYSTATPDKGGVVGATALKMGVSDNTQKLIDGGMITTYILLGIALVSLIVLEIRNFFK